VDICNVREGKRIFSLVVCSGLLGGGTAGLLIQTLAKTIRTDNLLVLWSIMFFILSYFVKSKFSSSPHLKTDSGVTSQVTETITYFKESHIIKVLMANFLLYAVVIYFLDFQFNKIVNQTFTELDSLTSFYGTYSICFYTTTLFIQLIFANRILKYFGTGNFILTDSYISVIEAIKHAAYFLKIKPEISWIDAEEFEKNPRQLKELSKYQGVIIPGGFGSRGVEGKIATIKYLRSNKIPFLGLCYGMQLSVIEYSRSVVGLKNAHTTEVNSETPYPVIDILPEQKKHLADKNYGATMRLGAYPAAIKKKTIVYSAYKEPLISERHRHRYEVNPDYIERIEKKGLLFSGFSPNRRLMEIIELPKEKHPFFVASQFHPELKSRPFKPHPLFREFIKAAINKK